MNNNFNFIQRLRNAYNVFLDRSKEEVVTTEQHAGSAYSTPLFRKRFNYGTDRSLVSAIYNRASIDVAALKFSHVRVDKNETFKEEIDSGLNRCLNVEANIDQTHRAFIQDVVMSMFDEGVVAVVPTDTSISLVDNNAFDILTLRTAKIVQWYPHYVKLRVYNDNTGEKEDITLHKSKVAIIENPLYAVMNEPSSILKRLINKLNILDAIDEQSGSGKLDLIMQLPFVVKSDKRKEQAEARRKDIQDQLKDSQYGIAYVDATEKITQLNRPAENQMMSQIEYLTRMLFSQLGISEAILDGSADEKELLNYYNRTVEPIASSISTEFKRKFLTKTAQTQGQSVMHFRNLFSIVTPERLADLADKLTRNEIASPNDMRAVMGWRPSKDEGADELRNRNLNQVQPGTEQPINVTDQLNKSVGSDRVGLNNQSKGE